ncbi:hypothetical protein D1007_07314 [Hordeum vulgare]|nr:hypothetical protein D1007_07314 [Hordeum vulgare]
MICHFERCEKSYDLGTKYINLGKEKNKLQLDLEVTTNDLNHVKQTLEGKDKALAEAKERTEAAERKLRIVGKLEEENTKLKQ